MKRREFMKNALVAGLGCSLLPAGCWFNRPVKENKKVIVLGIDGMDPHLSLEYMKQGILPNFEKLASKGSMHSLETSFPPQSPVAWSNFTVGAPTKVHGIYDFIHRDPRTMIPYLSTSKVIPPNKTFGIGNLKIPLSKGKTENLRQGKPFWEYLANKDIPTTIFKVPANFPCINDKIDMVSGMGTPDLRGGYGSYTLFTTIPRKYPEDITGGKVIPVVFQGQKAEAHLPGPHNTLEKNETEIRIPMEILRDKGYPMVRIIIQGKEFLLKQGEWSEWIQLSFPMLEPFYDVKGICKLFVKSVHPEFNLYVSPINIDPSDPALPVVSSKKYGEALVRDVGYFYTQGFPEDTKALSEGVLSEDEYLDLAYQIINERNVLMNYELTRFSKQETGMLFFYFSSLDQDTHMYWRTIDPEHPLYGDEINQKYGDTLKKIYVEMDRSLGGVLNENDMNDPNFSLMVMSDHGFAPFRRQVNVNTWLFKNDYLTLLNTSDIENKGYFENVNWPSTGAYSVGINSIYLNLKGRERQGVVQESMAKNLREEIRRNLLRLVDPKTGKKAVTSVWIIPDEERMMNPQAPDLVIGWNYGYRTSWDSILGGFSNRVFSDNLDKWSGDHCIDPNLVPGVLFANRRVMNKNPSLCDITPTILDEFQITPNQSVEGTALF